MFRLLGGIVAAGLATLSVSAPAQTSSPAARGTPAPPVARDDSVPDEIVVEGYRKRQDLDTQAVLPGQMSAVKNRKAYEYSERLAKCAARSRLSDLSRLRAVVDGEFNTATHAIAQDRLKRIYITCTESPALLTFTAAPQTSAQQDVGLSPGVRGNTGGEMANISDAAPLGRSIYDRGAFTVQAIKMFAPDLKLRKRQTADPQVQARFNAREVPRNRFRVPLDYHYFEAAVCMVRVEPELAVRLAMSDGAARFGDVQAALIDRARICVGGARKVKVDPTQFRLYIADAVYRWTVAARGVDTLIADGPKSRG